MPHWHLEGQFILPCFLLRWTNNIWENNENSNECGEIKKNSRMNSKKGSQGEIKKNLGEFGE